MPQRRRDDDLIEADDRKNADFLAAQVLGRADAGTGDEAVGVLVEIGADDDDVRARERRSDMRLRRDDVELDLAGRQSMSRLGTAAKKNRFESKAILLK